MAHFPESQKELEVRGAGSGAGLAPDPLLAPYALPEVNSEPRVRTKP